MTWFLTKWLVSWFFIGEWRVLSVVQTLGCEGLRHGKTTETRVGIPNLLATSHIKENHTNDSAKP